MNIPILQQQFDTVIRQKTLPGSIPTTDVADQLDSISNELIERGVKFATDIDNLKSFSGDDVIYAFLPGYGIYKLTIDSNLLKNDYEIIESAVVDQYWVLVHPVRRKGSEPNNYIKYFDFPGYVFTGGDDGVVPVENITYAGEFVNAIALLVHTGNYDKLSFTGGDRTSTATFNKFVSADTNRRFRIRVNVDTLGSATSFIGVWLKNVNALNDAASASRGMYVNLNNGTIFRFVGGSNADITTGGAGTVTWSGPAAASLGVAANGDELEVIYETNGKKGQDIFTVNNLTTGYSLIGFIGSMIFAQQAFNQFGNATTAASLILAGVNTDYIFKGFDCESTIPERPFLLLMGDSMASGYAVSDSTSLYGKLSNKLNYNVASFTGPGMHVNSLAKAMREVTLQRPKYVLFFGWLALYWGDFQNADPDYATFYASWTKMMKTIVASGAIPILAKYPAWPAGGESGTSQPNWSAFIDAEASTYNALIVDLRTQTFAYNGGAGFHLGGADNEKVVAEVLKVMGAAGAFTS